MTNSELAPLELLGLEENGRAPKMRVDNVNSARSIYKAIKDSDQGSSKNRALVDAMFNGAAPFNQQDLIEMGQGERTNLDFGEASALKEQALAGYYDLTSSVDVLARISIDFGSPEQKVEWERILAEEFTRTLKEWQEFEFNHQMLADQFVSHGVGVCYFEDEVDWRWRVAGLSEFRLPRGTRASEWEIEVATVDREYQAHQLYKFIEDPAVAKDLGWNVKMVKQALIRACRDSSFQEAGEWEKLEVELKNNDLLYGNSRGKKVHVVHMWVREFDGKVSHLMFLKDPIGSDENAKEEDFLFKRPNRFAAPTNCFVTFCYGVGNGTYHGIRGLGYKVYPHIQLLNRLRCGMVDGALLSSALIVQPGDNGSRALEDLTLSYYGPYALFPPGLKIVEKAIPNYNQNLMPVLNDLTMNMQNRTIGYQSRSITPDGQSRTAYEVRAQLQQEAVLGAAAINLFYHPWKRLLREAYRRLVSRDYAANEPGGREAVDFKKRCIARGVPTEAIHRFSTVEPVRAIGYGSPGMRSAAIDETMQIFGSLDEAGRINLLRDRIAARFGQEVVDRYLPSPSVTLRTPIDDKIAMLENSDLSMGTMLPVNSGENHFIHASRHLTSLDGLDAAVSQGQAEPAAAMKAYATMIPHLGQHLQLLAADVARQDQIALMRQRFQQLSASAKRLSDELAAAAEQQAKAEQAEQARMIEAERARIAQMEQQLAEAQMLSPKAQADLIERRAKLEMQIEKHQVDMQTKQAKVMQELALKDAKTAAEISPAAQPTMP
jgi:hypothetical protein